MAFELPNRTLALTLFTITAYALVFLFDYNALFNSLGFIIAGHVVSYAGLIEVILTTVVVIYLLYYRDLNFFFVYLLLTAIFFLAGASYFGRML